jgi:hypothetical protein
MAGSTRATTEAPHIRRFDEDFRRDQLELNSQSLFYFLRVSLGMDRLGPLQADLCAFLEGRKGAWLRACVCAYRSSYKSTCTTIGYPLWRALHMPSWSCIIVEGSEDNAFENHFSKIVGFFTSSTQADYLNWLYSHKIPDNFRGWNNNQVNFLQKNPLKSASIRYSGIRGKREGAHVDCIIADDLEGADSEESNVPNQLSWNAYKSFVPLMEEQTTGQILVVGTPWGDNPLVYRMREMEADGSIDNSKRKFMKLWWVPIVDAKGVPFEPKYTPARLEQLKAEMEDLYDTQYLLLKKSSKAGVFKMDRIRHFTWRLTPDGNGIEYLGTDFNPNEIDAETGAIIPTEVPCTVRIKDLRFFLHIDPTHRLDEEMKSKAHDDRPSRAAIAVIGVAPDNHAFLMQTWHEDADLNATAKKAMQLFRKWSAFKATVETIGAQVWFKQFIKQRERMETMAGFLSDSALLTTQLMTQRRMSENIIEAPNQNKSKDWLFREALAPWLNRGLLHLHEDRHEHIFHQLDNLTNTTVAIDVIDAMAQGPNVWSPAPDYRGIGRALNRRRSYVQQKRHRLAGYMPPQKHKWLPVVKQRSG